MYKHILHMSIYSHWHSTSHLYLELDPPQVGKLNSQGEVLLKPDLLDQDGRCHCGSWQLRVVALQVLSWNTGGFIITDAY